jgi:hypothetical protein
VVERQKLIHSGKVLKDEQSVGELGLSESDFIVCMITKEVAKVFVFVLTLSFFPLRKF